MAKKKTTPAAAKPAADKYQTHADPEATGRSFAKYNFDPDTLQLADPHLQDQSGLTVTFMLTCSDTGETVTIREPFTVLSEDLQERLQQLADPA